MKRNEKLKLIKRFVLAIFILSTAVTITGDGESWTAILALMTGGYLSAYAYANANHKQKNARSAGTHTSNKVLPFSKITNNIIIPKARKVK